MACVLYVGGGAGYAVKVQGKTFAQDGERHGRRLLTTFLDTPLGVSRHGRVVLMFSRRGCLLAALHVLTGLGWAGLGCSHAPGVVAGVYGLVPQAEFLISLKGMVQVRD
eukprot:COSAG04_NODE_587_length_12330_cov_4.053552_7_plen_109_part_00